MDRAELRHNQQIMRSADEIAYEITAVYYDDDKVADMVRRAREEMRDECAEVAMKWHWDKIRGPLAEYADLASAIRAIPNR